MTRKDQIIQSCMDIFSEEGAEGLTMKAIASRVNITEPAIYRHFLNKQDVMISMLDKTRDELFSAVDQIIDRPLSSVEKLHHIFKHHLSFLEEKKGITVALLSESFVYRRPKMRRQMLLFLKEYFMKIRRLISVGIQKGEIASSVNPHAATIVFLGTLQHLITIYKLSGKEQDVNSISGTVFEHYKRVLMERNA